MDKNKIIIDIDLTIVRTDLGWLEWLETSSKVFYEESYRHDLLKERGELLPTLLFRAV